MYGVKTYTGMHGKNMECLGIMFIDLRPNNYHRCR